MRNKKAEKVLLSVGSFLAMVGSFWLITDSFLSVIGAILAVTTHQIGHAYVLKKHNIEWGFGFEIFGGEIVPTEPKDLRKLTFEQKAEYYLAGPQTNMLAILIFLAGMVLLPGARELFSALIVMNAMFMWLHLIPVESLDGGGFLKAIFEGSSEQEDVRIVRKVAALSTIGAAILFLTTNIIGWEFPIMAGMTWYLSREDDPANGIGDSAIPKSVVSRMVWMYILMFWSYMMVTPFIPEWLQLPDINDILSRIFKILELI